MEAPTAQGCGSRPQFTGRVGQRSKVGGVAWQRISCNCISGTPTSLAALWWVYCNGDFTPQCHLPPFLQQKLRDVQLRQLQGVRDKRLNPGTRQESAGPPRPSSSRCLGADFCLPSLARPQSHTEAVDWKAAERLALRSLEDRCSRTPAPSPGKAHAACARPGPRCGLPGFTSLLGCSASTSDAAHSPDRHPRPRTRMPRSTGRGRGDLLHAAG